MTTKFIDCENLVLYNENGNNVYIKPADGQTLSVDATIAQTNAIANSFTFTGDTDTGLFKGLISGATVKVDNIDYIKAGGDLVDFDKRIQVPIGTAVANQGSITFDDIDSNGFTRIWASLNTLNAGVGTSTLSHWSSLDAPVSKNFHYFGNNGGSSVAPNTYNNILYMKASGVENGISIDKTDLTFPHNLIELRTQGGYCGGLQVTGASSCTLITISDARAKTDISESTGNLEVINKLSVKNYRFKADKDQGRIHTGLLAQDVLNIPELKNVVSTGYAMTDEELEECQKDCNKNPSYLSMSYIDLIPHLIGAVNELSNTVREMKAKLDLFE